MMNKILEEVGKSFGRQVFEAFVAHGAVALAENVVAQGLDYLKNKKLIELTKEGAINNTEQAGAAAAHPGESVHAHPRVVVIRAASNLPQQNQEEDYYEEDYCCNCCNCSCHNDEYYDEELDEEDYEEEPKSKSNKKKQSEPEPKPKKSKSKSAKKD